MRKSTFSFFLILAVLTECWNVGNQPKQVRGKIAAVDFSCVKITDNFWAPRLSNHATTTLAVCIDQIENQTVRMRNFENAAKKNRRTFGNLL
jgi:hypothetical protein